MASPFARSANAYSSIRPKNQRGLVEFTLLVFMATFVVSALIVLIANYRIPLFVAAVCAGENKTVCTALQTASQNNILYIDTVNRTAQCDLTLIKTVMSTEDYVTLKQSCREINKWSQNIILARMAAAAAK